MSKNSTNTFAAAVAAAKKRSHVRKTLPPPPSTNTPLDTEPKKGLKRKASETTLAKVRAPPKKATKATTTSTPSAPDDDQRPKKKTTKETPTTQQQQQQRPKTTLRKQTTTTTTTKDKTMDVEFELQDAFEDTFAVINTDPKNATTTTNEDYASADDSQDIKECSILEYLLVFQELQTMAANESDFATKLPQEYETVNFHRSPRSAIACLPLLNIMSAFMEEKEGADYFNQVLFKPDETDPDYNKDMSQAECAQLELDRNVISVVLLYHRLLQKMGYLTAKVEFDSDNLKTALNQLYREYNSKDLWKPAVTTTNSKPTPKQKAAPLLTTTPNKLVTDDTTNKTKNNSSTTRLSLAKVRAPATSHQGNSPKTLVAAAADNKKKTEDTNSSVTKKKKNPIVAASTDASPKVTHSSSSKVPLKDLTIVKPKGVTPISCSTGDTIGEINLRFTLENVAYAYRMEHIESIEKKGDPVEAARWYLVGLTEKSSTKNNRVTKGFQQLPFNITKQLYSKDGAKTTTNGRTSKKDIEHIETLAKQFKTIQAYKDGDEENIKASNFVKVLVPHHCENQLPKSLKGTHIACTFNSLSSLNQQFAKKPTSIASKRAPTTPKKDTPAPPPAKKTNKEVPKGESPSEKSSTNEQNASKATPTTTIVDSTSITTPSSTTTPKQQPTLAEQHQDDVVSNMEEEQEQEDDNDGDDEISDIEEEEEVEEEGEEEYDDDEGGDEETTREQQTLAEEELEEEERIASGGEDEEEAEEQQEEEEGEKEALEDNVEDQNE